jgi:error-prone DNA polymerase
MSRFCHLNVASSYSAHFGVDSPEQLAATAATMGFEAIAITDRDGLYGAVKHIGACIAAGITPIIGVNLAILDPAKRPAGRVTFLAHGNKSGAGWAALCRIVSRAHQSKTVGILKTEIGQLIAPQGEPVCTVLLGPESDLAEAVLIGSANARTTLNEWLELLPQRNMLAIELVSHLAAPESRYSTRQARKLLRLADAAELPAILTNAVRYAEPDGALTADVLDAARNLESLGLFEPQPNAQAWLKTGSAMASIALEIAEDATAAKRLLTATNKLAERCHINPTVDCDWGKPKTPELAALGISDNPFEVLWQKAHSAVAEKYPTARAAKLADIQHRLASELITINQLGFASYFLTVADVAQMIRDMRIRIAARGSGAGSLVNFLLGISGVDPIEHGLLFERFLSTERSTLPDIDIDVESARRHDIYRNIFKRYGGNRVTLLSMQSTYRGRGAVRDSGLALGIDEDTVDEIAKSIWRFSASSFRGAIATKPELKTFASAIQTDRKLNLLVDLTERLDRLPRHISMHPCGVILGNSRLLELTPTQPSGLGLPMSQFDKDDMDPMGFLKLDVLGVRMQSAMAFATAEIARVKGERIDLDGIPKDDPKVYELIRSTNTLGMFQIESPGQRELTGKHQPTEFNDLTLQISLFRPGPMKGNMIAPYLSGRHGFETPDYLHPKLKPILLETYGVVVFHEQVMRIMKVMTGCSLAQADEFRRSLSKPEKAKKIKRYFCESAAARGFGQDLIVRIWSILEGFSSFGFCKAHGAAFALPTYQSAWLKAHHPTEFIAGLLTHDPGMYPRRLLLAEARKIGVELLPIDVNKSNREFSVEKHGAKLAVRMSISEISAISEPEVSRILQHRPFTDLRDFYLRARPSRRTMRNLAAVGALDSLFGITPHPDSADTQLTRGDLMVYVRQLTARTARRRDPEQLELDLASFQYEPLGIPEPSTVEKIETELDLLKMDFSGHQLDEYRGLLQELNVVYASELVGLRNNSEVLVAGIRVATQTPPMRSGKRVVFISLDDGTGCADATFFDEAQQRASDVMFSSRLLLVAGKIRRTGVRGVSVLAENAWDLRTLYAQWKNKSGPMNLITEPL